MASATSITGSVPTAITAAGSYATVVTVGGQASNSFTCTISAGGGGGTSAPFPNSAEGFTIPTISKVAKQLVAPHMGANGAGGNINAWAVDLARCSGRTSPAITSYWHHNIDMYDHAIKVNSDYIDMGPNQALTYQFTTTNTTYIGQVYTDQGANYSTSTFISISTTPCDFDAAKAVANNACYATSGTPINGMFFEVTNNVSGYGCKLNTNTTYYLNVRWQNAAVVPAADACAAAGQSLCGLFMQIKKF
ncbi:MAG TPA: hypothetical protein VFV17_02535 [Usitatibacteraceae bacterium]|nr:hypothetical protein [Usitatibacteraceae bacterium]